MLEAFLLAGVVLLTFVMAPTNIVFIIVLVVVLLLCLPVIRLVRMHAPPFVPTPKASVQTMMEFAEITPGERSYDLGCGDGRVVRAAAKRGAVATGFELSAPTFLLATLLCLGHCNTRILYKNFWDHDFCDADVVTCFLLMGAMKTLKEKIWPQLKPGTRLVSFVFRLPGVTPVKQAGNNIFLYVKE